MTTPDNVNLKQTTPTQKKSDFSGFLRAIDVDRLNPANNAQKPFTGHRRIAPRKQDALNAHLLQATGVIISVMWLGGAALYVDRSVGWNNVASMMPHELGGFLAGILAPIALFWMIAAFILRSNDVKMYAEALRSELQSMIFPSEEADRRVNNDIERLMRQTAEMSKATRIALGTIEAARESLKNEVVLMDSKTRDTVDHLEVLGKTLASRMQDAIQMGGELESTIKSIEERTANSNQSWGKMISDLGNQADIAEQKINNSQNQLQGTLTRVTETGDAIEEKLSSTSTATEIAVARLSEMLRDRLESLGSLHQETEEALQRAATEMASQRGDMRDEADAIEMKMQDIAAAIQQSTNKMYDFTDDALTKARLIETRLQGQGDALQQVVTQSLEQAQKLADTNNETISRLQDTTTNTMNETQKIENVLRQAIDRLEDKVNAHLQKAQESMDASSAQLVQHVEQAATQANTITDKLFTDIGQQVTDTTGVFATIESQIEAMIGLFDQGRGRLDGASTLARETAEDLQATLNLALEKVRETTGALHGGITSVSQSLEQPVSLLETAAALAHTRAGEIGQLLEGKTLELTRTTQAMGETANALHHTLHSKGQDVALLAGQIATHLKAVGQELDQKNQILEERTSKSVQSLQEMNAVQQSVSDNLVKLQNQTAVTADQSVSSSETIQQRINLLQQLHQALVEDSTQSQNGLDRVSERLNAASANAVETIKGTVDSMATLQTDYQQLSQSGLENIRKLEQGYRDTLNTVNEDYHRLSETGIESVRQLEQGYRDVLNSVNAEYHNLSQTGTESIQQLEQGYRETLNALNEDYQRLSQTGIESVRELEHGYRGTLENVKAETEETVNTVKALHQTIQTHTREAKENADLHLAMIQKASVEMKDTAQNLETFGDTLQNQTSRVQELGQSALTTLAQVSSSAAQVDETLARGDNQVSIHVQSIQDMMTQLEARATQSASQLIMQEETLEQSIQSQMSKMNDINQSFVSASQQVNDSLNHTMQFAGDVASKVSQSMQTLRDENDQAEQSLAQSFMRLLAQGEQIDQSTTKLVEKINQANEDLIQQGQSLQGTGDDLLQRLHQATMQIGNKAEALEQAAKTAQKQAELLREQQSKIQAEQFFNATKFVVESLHSLALDFTRLLEGELHDKTWRSYQKGDLGSFTRRLLNARDEQTQEKIHTKFQDDPEFRTYAQRYLRQFEEIYDSANDNDHAELLTSIFSTSDVGKLYQFLCTSLGREPRLAKRL